MSSAAFFLFLFPCIANGDWSQQYGDASSSNFVEITNPDDSVVTSGWNYTVNEDYSIFYGSPAVSEKGVVYLPFLEYPQYWLQLRAILPNGSMHWLANWVGGDEDCSVIFMTNAVYSQEHGLVVVGWTCTDAGAYYQKQGQIVAYNAETGSEKWRSPMLYDANDMSTLSISDRLVYASGGYSCGRDGGAVQHPHKNISQIVVLDLTNGKLVQAIDFEHVGCYSQTKVFTSGDVTRVIIPANLPFLFHKLNGSLLCLECQKNSKCTKKWFQHIDISWDVSFGLSSDGFVYGAYGLKGNPNTVFGLDLETGKVAFSNKGHCDEGSYPSGPTVDARTGHAYYSCGNLVFALDSKGSLVWKSKPFDSSPGYQPLDLLKLSPAVFSSKQMLIVVNTNSSSLVTVSTVDGSLLKKYDIPKLAATDNGVREPPIIAGNSVYLIKSHNLNKYYLFSLSLNKVSF